MRKDVERAKTAGQCRTHTGKSQQGHAKCKPECGEESHSEWQLEIEKETTRDNIAETEAWWMTKAQVIDGQDWLHNLWDLCKMKMWNPLFSIVQISRQQEKNMYTSEETFWTWDRVWHTHGAGPADRLPLFGGSGSVSSIDSYAPISAASTLWIL